MKEGKYADEKLYEEGNFIFLNLVFLEYNIFCQYYMHK